MLVCGVSYRGHPTNFFTSLPIRGREICVTCTAPPCHANPTVQFARLVELKFSSFSSANFTDHHFAHYLALEKNIGALERKMNHALSESYESFPVLDVATKFAFGNKSICYFAIVARWHLYWEKSIRFCIR